MSPAAGDPQTGSRPYEADFRIRGCVSEPGRIGEEGVRSFFGWLEARSRREEECRGNCNELDARRHRTGPCRGPCRGPIGRPKEKPTLGVGLAVRLRG